MIYELGQVPEATATELVQVLDLDPGHLSRVLAGLAASGLVARKRSPDDGRRQLLSLTRAGTAAFKELDRRSTDQSSLLLEQLTLDDQSRLLTAMSTIEEVLGPRSQQRGLVLRSPAPGRVWLGRRAPRRPLRARVRLRRELRGPRRADRRRVRPAPRSRSRASLDRRPRRRARRLGLLRRRRRRRREAPPPDRRPRRPGPPGRQPARRRVHPLRPRPRLPRADPLDPEPARSRPPHLYPSRLRAHGEGEAEAAVRRQDRFGDLAARALRAVVCVVAGSGQVALAAYANWPHSSRGHAGSFDLQDPAGSASGGGFAGIAGVRLALSRCPRTVRSFDGSFRGAVSEFRSEWARGARHRCGAGAGGGDLACAGARGRRRRARVAGRFGGAAGGGRDRGARPAGRVRPDGRDAARSDRERRRRGDRGDRAHRHPRQQRRPRARESGRGRHRGRLRLHLRREPQGDVLRQPGGRPRDDRARAAGRSSTSARRPARSRCRARRSTA